MFASFFLGGKYRHRRDLSKVIGLVKQAQGIIDLAFCYFHVIKFLHYPCHLAHLKINPRARKRSTMALLEPPGLRSLERTGLKPRVQTDLVLSYFSLAWGRGGFRV